MLKKLTFKSDAEMNEFFATNVDQNGHSTFYMVKPIIFFNPVLRAIEYHVFISTNGVMKGGEHTRKNGGDVR